MRLDTDGGFGWISHNQQCLQGMSQGCLSTQEPVGQMVKMRSGNAAMCLDVEAETQKTSAMGAESDLKVSSSHAIQIIPVTAQQWRCAQVQEASMPFTAQHSLRQRGQMK